MALTLQLVNETTLPDGGPVSIHVTGKRGIDIGRATHLDWTLPDPTRYISSKHCEIRYKDGGYWLHDVSTNGTFVNGADHRMHEPHRLRTGDRFLVGQYIVAVSVDGSDEGQEDRPREAPAPIQNMASDQQWWATESDAPPPIDPKQLRSARIKAPINPDFLDWAADVPDPFQQVVPAPSPAAAVRPPPPTQLPAMDWAEGPPSRVEQAPPRPAPTPVPRRPAGSDNPESAWADTVPAAAPAPPPPDLSPIQRRPAEIDNPQSAWTEPAPGANPAPPPSIQSPAAATPVSPISERNAPGPSLSSDGATAAAFVHAMATAAGLSPEVFGYQGSNELAKQIGAVLRLSVENLMQLLSARQQAKRLAHSSEHTTIQATDNNPLKFCPTVQDALRIMFGPANAGYLDAQRAIGQGFADLKAHQIKTYAAMQRAVTMAIADLDPQKIKAEGGGAGGLRQLRNAKLWDAYEARWNARIGRKGGEPIEAFMRYFAEAYDQEG